MQSGAVVNASKDLVEQQALWVVQITAAYQFDMDEDGDPNDEDPLYGGTRQFDDYDHATVFVECCRELYDDRFRLVESGANPEIGANARNNLKHYIRATAAHEIGHMPGSGTEDDEHAENGLMRNGGVSKEYPDLEVGSIPPRSNDFVQHKCGQKNEIHPNHLLDWLDSYEYVACRQQAHLV